jgi:hypothetical protein
MKILRALLALMLVTCPIAGSAAEDVKKVSYKEMIRLNSVNVTKITTGMTKDEVLQIMGNTQSRVRSGPIGNPWKIEIHGGMEILHYITAGHPPFVPIMANQATPVILKAGKVIGMGRGVLKQVKASASPDPTQPRDSSEKSIEERLETLKKLYDNGTIDKESYETQKKRILESI